MSSQHLLGTDEGDADTLLLETVISGNLDPLKDLLLRLKTAADPNGTRDVALLERITRTFLAAINEGPEPSLQLLLDTDLVDIQSEDDINERNCLHQATIYGNSFVLGVGISKQVSVSRVDVYGRVPLHYACMHGRLEMMEALLNGMSSPIHLYYLYLGLKTSSRSNHCRFDRPRQLHTLDSCYYTRALHMRSTIARTLCSN